MPSDRHAPMNAIALIGAVALAILGLVGCTPSETAPPATASTEQINGLPEGVRLPEDLPTEVPNSAEDRANVAIGTCEASDGGWRAGGTAVNTGDAEVTYEITVFFTTEGGTVIGYGGTEAAVPASKTADWSVEAEFVAPDSTQCVLRGVAKT